VGLCRPWVPAWGPCPANGRQCWTDQGKWPDLWGGRKFFFAYLTTRMHLPIPWVIFPAGTYYPQVHPQPVENRLQQLDDFDHTSTQ
jgi:hypothetical protein